MTRNKEHQDLHVRDLIPALGISGYFLRVFRELDLHEIRKVRVSFGLNSSALFAYNVAIGLGADYLIQNYY